MVLGVCDMCGVWHHSVVCAVVRVSAVCGSWVVKTREEGV